MVECALGLAGGKARDIRMKRGKEEKTSQDTKPIASWNTGWRKLESSQLMSRRADKELTLIS